MTDVPQSLRDGRYHVVGVLGEGAQATTFDAVDVRSGLAVAVKRFRVHGARSWKDVELAEREASVLSTLSHPLLPRYVEHFEERGELFLVTEKIEGESLSSLRRRGVAFNEVDVARLLGDAAQALGYLHGRTPPIVHRDLKPSNVIRRPDGSFAFIDFGSVRDRMKPEGGSTVVGTFGYMAPEQFQGRAMPASDVYAIGATALSLLTGREPEHLPHRGLGIDVRAALEGFRVRPKLVEVLSAMLTPAPDERVQAIRPLVPETEEPAPAKRRSAQRGSRASEEADDVPSTPEALAERVFTGRIRSAPVQLAGQ
jgi:serine/threonine protein kinase